MNFLVPSYNLADMKEKLAATCKKFKVDFDIKVGEKHVIYTYKIDCPVTFKKRTVEVQGHDVEVNIPEMDKFINTGATYLGCIKRDGIVTVHPTAHAENIEHSLSSLEEEIKTFPCHECNKSINRKIMHVFEDDATGEIKVYGSGCAVKKFGVNINSLISKFEGIYEAMIEDYGDEGIWGDFGGGMKVYNAEYFCSFAYNLILKAGYVSGSEAWGNEGVFSTKDRAIENYNEFMNAPVSSAIHQVTIEEFNENDFSYEKFSTWVVEFVNEMDEGDFKFNLLSVIDIFSENFVNKRTAGYVAWLTFKYWYDNVRIKAEVIEYNTDHSGYSVGDKFKNLHVQVVNEFITEGYYGTTFIYTLRGKEDNIKYKWFASNPLEEGVEYILTSGCIKALEDDAKWGKAVVITRCRKKIYEEK